jgi:hypothetical protein
MNRVLLESLPRLWGQLILMRMILNSRHPEKKLTLSEEDALRREWDETGEFDNGLEGRMKSRLLFWIN